MVALVFVPLLDSKKFKGPKAASKNVGDSWLGLSVASAGLTRRLRGAYAGGAGSF